MLKTIGNILHVSLLLVSLVVGTDACGEGVDVRDYGAIGDGVTDDTQAIRSAIKQAASESNGHIHFPAGVYRLTDGIELPASVIMSGAGSPKLGTFPLKDDDKRFLCGDLLSKMPGTTLLFTGRGKATSTTNRHDQFASVRYAVKTGEGMPFQIQSLAIVMDVTVVDAGDRLTTPDTDHRADYDVGLLVDDSPGGTLRDVCVFGYWRQAGLCLVSMGRGSNPDYNTFWNCSFSGEYGVALLGANTEDGPGLSGTQFYGCNLYSADHHHRPSGEFGSGALLIDGKTAGKKADINGHSFFGGCVRTYSNTAVRLDHASNVNFHSVVFEVPARDGDDGNQTGRVMGTENTRDVRFFGCRMHDIGLRELGTQMSSSSVMVAGDAGGGLSVYSRGGTTRVAITPQGDPVVQLATEGNSSTSGWTLLSDRSHNDGLVARYDNEKLFELRTDGRMISKKLQSQSLSLGKARRVEIRNGSADVSQSSLRLFGKTSAGEMTCRLSTLGVVEEGAILVLQLDPHSAPVLIDNHTGNIRVTRPITFDHSDDRLMLISSGKSWVELSRSDISQPKKMPNG